MVKRRRRQQTRRTRARRRCSRPQGREWLGLLAGWALRNARVEFPTHKCAQQLCVSNISIALYLCKQRLFHAFSCPSARPSVCVSCVLPLLYCYTSSQPLTAIARPHSHSHYPCYTASAYTQPARIIAPTADTKLPAITTHFPSLSRAHAHQYNTSEPLRRIAS
jgi:hypothetical protein